MIYNIFNNGKWEETNRTKWLYWYNEFGRTITNYDGNEIKKDDMDLDNAFEVYNPQGVLVAYKE